MKALPKQYDHKSAEKKWQQEWETRKIYAWDASLPREQTYVIDTPPPTVSGVLHMGHIFSYTQADFVARYQRMSGKTVFYPMGFDDNGLPTERLVEKIKGKKAAQYPTREDFIKDCMEVSEEARKEFRRLFTSVALSVDWAQEYHTISEHSRRMSQLSFLDLMRKGHAYRKLQPMLWDPVDQTAIAQAEIEDKEMGSHMNQIIFFVDGVERPRNEIIIATTRPELIPACVGIFYHPDDARYQHLKDKEAITPLFGVKVPILEDDTVEMEKGTGIMMCCTFGDEADIKKWEKHSLPAHIVLNKYGKMDNLDMIGTEWKSVQSPERLQEYKDALKGLKAVNAREKILEILKSHDCLVKSEAITHSVKCAERSGAPLEILPTYQWFVKVLDKKEALHAKAEECTWYPPYMQVRMDQWIDGLSWDWCISRQRFFGVPFPVWYSKRAGEEGKILLADPEQLPVNPLKDLPKGYSQDEVEPEPDVMDTWATSSVSPQISSGGITKEFCDDPARHARLFPADLRPQAHEIIRTWAFYTVVKAHLHENVIPWKNLMISGWCLAADKSKMSKSKGNVITPVDLIEEKGADAVRYWTSTSRLGVDTAYSEDALKIGKKLVTKLWNASNFVAIQLEKLSDYKKSAAESSDVITETLDKWILTRLHRAVSHATKEFERYEYCDARVAVDDFFWNDFCDNYLELVKARAYGEGCSEAAQRSAIHTLYHCLEGILRLYAPFLPHVTEDIYSHLFEDKKLTSLHARGTWPKAADYPVDEAAEKAGVAALSLLNAIRKAKSERNVSIKYPLTNVVVSPKADVPGLEKVFFDLKAAANAAEIAINQQVLGDSVVTEDGAFQLKITFAEQGEAA